MTKTKLAATLLALIVGSSWPLPGTAQNARAGQLYEDALVRYRAKDLAGAEIQLKNALQQDRRFLPALVLLGRVSLEDGKAGAAEVAFEEALAQGASRSEVAPLLARAMVSQGRHGAMLQLPALNPEGLPPAAQYSLLLIRAAAQIDLGDPRAAMAQIERARALRPDDPESYLAEVPLRIRSAAFTEATAAATRALRLNPQLADAHYQLGTIHHAMGRLDDALRSYGEALARSPEHLEALIARAGIAIDRGQFEQAARDLQLVRKNHPNDPRADYLSALVAQHRGDNAAAIAAMRRVAELLGPVPLDTLRFRPQLLMLAGLAFHALEEPQKAIPYLDLLVKQQPRSPSSKLLAQMLYQGGQVENGIQLLEAYLRVQPGDHQAVALLAQGHTSQGRAQRAAQLSEQALKSRNSAELQAALGQALFAMGRLEPARQALEASWKLNPRLIATGLSLVLVYSQLKQPAKALASAQMLVKQHPDLANTHHLLAVAQSGANDLKGARASLERALQLDRNHLQARLALARLDAREGKFDVAVRRLETLHRENEARIDPLLELGALAAQRGQTEVAERWLDRAVTLASARETRPNFALIDLLMRSGRHSKAVDAARMLVAKAPDDGRALLALARTQLAVNDLSAARASLLQAGRRLPQELDSLLEVGELQLQAGDAAAAAYSLAKAVELQPQSSAARVKLASAEMQRGELDRAAQQVERVLALEPRAARSHLLAAELAMARKQPTQALAALRRAHELQPSQTTAMRLVLHLQSHESVGAAIEVGEQWLKRQPNDEEVRRAMAELQMVVGRWPAARGHFERLLARNPNDVISLNNLALVLLRQNELKGAREHAERAHKLAPSQALVIDTLAWVLHHQGEQARALQLLRDARLRAPDHAEIRYHLAVVLAKLGQVAEARSELQAALAAPLGLESENQARTLLSTLR